MVRKMIRSFVAEDTYNRLRPLIHGTRSLLAALRYGFPGKQLKTISITSTKGKTTTAVLTGRLLNTLGVKTGYVTTAVIYLGQGEEILNPFKMTTLDGPILQNYLRQMVKNGCTSVVVEMSSQGLEQNRHWGLGGFDLVMFSNFSPEHIEAHGGLEQYRQSKAKLFRNVRQSGVFIGNSERPETEWFSQQVTAKGAQKILISRNKDFEIINSPDSIFKSIKVENTEYPTNFFSNVDILNLFFAVKTSQILTKKPMEDILQQAQKLTGIPGRMEFVHKSKALDILVDYAHEPESMKQLLETLAGWRDKKYYQNIIHVLSCDGVGRDDWKKPMMGDLSLQYADKVIVTTENYDERDNPEAILKALSEHYPREQENQTYFKALKRKDAFLKALEIAKSLKGKSLIVSTGVGSEQGLTQPGGKMEWDERVVWKSLV
jgi:UDP-N-acetylmuramoyl-L-alanyl-D-glutamate--2,6-diaminopimelate ligase